LAETNALAHVRRVRVGTRNGPKLEAVRDAFAAYAPDVTVEGADVESGVSEQPVGFPEIVAGARGRAHGAYRVGACDLAVGIEDGLVSLTGVEPIADLDAVLNVGAAVVTDGRREAFGLSSGFAYPEACSEQALRERAPIGDLFDALWRGRGSAPAAGVPAAAAAPSGRGAGNIGMLSLGVLRRSEYGRHAVLCALIRFLHPDLYFEGDDAPEPFPPALPPAPSRTSNS
jgi:inosine/xanthosine triphosphatase